ncbi:MAG: hypothetical protein EXS10_06855 [Phycisphaerales bacterium]|nr:hypothetical protein [Phycisphaerales bacterium]
MRLILVRHARAFERDGAAWPDDAKRPLVAEGRKAFIRLARKLKRVVREVDLVEASSFTRAWQTAQLLQEETGWPKPVRFELLEIEEESASPPQGVDQIERLVCAASALRAMGTVAWIGHEPTLSELISRLVVGDASANIVAMRKGAIVSLNLSFPREANSEPSARIEWMMHPKAC